MIMANNKIDADSQIDENSIDQSSQILSNIDPSAPCSCTQITRRQLFYALKLKFPGVPDPFITEQVEKHCHNSSACIEILKNYQYSVNVYPQALRNQTTKKNPNRGLPLPTINIQQSNLNRAFPESMGSITNKDQCDDKIKMKLNSATNDLPNEMPIKTPQRPNTLNLTNLNTCTTSPIRKPTRVAPPPPISTSTTPTASTKSNQQPLNVSLNVIVSPVSSGQPIRPPRSSVSFTLHQPNNNNQTVTIPVTTQSEQSSGLGDLNELNNTPSLVCRSHMHDPDTGYRSRLEITVAGSSPMNDNNSLTDDLLNTNNKINSSVINNNNYKDGKPLQSPINPILPSVSASPQFIEQSETVHRQILSKRRLEDELEKDRKRLERMQRENDILSQPLPEGGIELITKEIEKLRDDCNRMAQEVEEAGPSFALGETNEAFYKNIYTGQQLPMPAAQRQQLRPHRPAPVPDFRAIPPTNPNPNPSSITVSETGWDCIKCTFRNNKYTRICELCNMPFLSAGNEIGYMQSIPTASYPLTNYMPMSMPMPMPMPMQMPLQQSLPYHQHPNSLPHYFMYPPSTGSLPSHQPQSAQYFNSYQTPPMTAYENP